jgi:copper chaperone for superoxide dismutase
MSWAHLISIGITSLQTSLQSQTITVTSKLPPSTIQRALASSGRDAILRGSGLPDSAAVAILETYAPDLPQGVSPVRGLVRLVQVRDDLVLCDVGVSNLDLQNIKGGAKGTWAASVRQTGDVSDGPRSTGRIWTDRDYRTSNADTTRVLQETLQDEKGFLGLVEVDASGKGTAVLVKERVPIWELIGRGLVLEKVNGATPDSSVSLLRETPGSEAVVGVIARSAGVWDNDKTVCSCSGKTVWEEREEQRGRGML